MLEWFEEAKSGYNFPEGGKGRMSPFIIADKDFCY